MSRSSRTAPGKLLLLVVTVLVGAVMAGCGKKTENAPALIADARNYREKGDNNAAIIQLKNALQSNPDSSEARYLLGTIYNKTGDFQSAGKELRKALSLAMSPLKVMPDLGQTLLNLGQFQQVLDETEKLVGEKNSAEISTMRGSAFLALGKVDEAKDLFELALNDKAGFPGALIGMARYSLSRRDIEAAADFAEQAVTRNPESVDAWLFKGDLLRLQRKTDPALAAYDQVVKLKSNSFVAYLNKASLEIGAGRFEAADADIKAARKAAPGSLMVSYTQALLDFNQGKNSAALDSLQHVLSKVPEHMPSRLLAGAVQSALGSTQQAENHLKYYLDRDPADVYARKLLASVLLKSRQTRRAIDVLAPALKASQQDPQVLALAGESYMQARNFTKATEYFEKASNIAPESATLHTALGMSKLGQGQNSGAVTELEKATGLDEKSPQAGILLVMTHLRLKEYDKALAAANALEKSNPDNPVVQNLKGGIYLSKQDVPKARASFEKALAAQPAYFPAVANLAQLDLREKKPEAAKKRFEAILEKDKKNVQVMVALANLALSQRKPEEATECGWNDLPQKTLVLFSQPFCSRRTIFAWEINRNP